MASTGGGAARSGKKRNPDVADPEEASTAELVVSRYNRYH